MSMIYEAKQTIRDEYAAGHNDLTVIGFDFDSLLLTVGANGLNVHLHLSSKEAAELSENLREAVHEIDASKPVQSALRKAIATK